MHRIFGHRTFSEKNGPKVNFWFSAEILFSTETKGPKQEVMMALAKTATSTDLSVSTNISEKDPRTDLQCSTEMRGRNSSLRKSESWPPTEMVMEYNRVN